MGSLVANACTSQTKELAETQRTQIFGLAMNGGDSFQLKTALRFLSFSVATIILCLVSKSAKAESTATFIRGVNLNGPVVEVDSRTWQAGDSGDIRSNGSRFENETVILKPAAKASLQKILHSSCWGSKFDVELLNLQEESYRVFLYVWEDNQSESFQILLNDQVVVQKYESGPAGQWNRLGPWMTTSNNGTIKISARGGAANFSGVEIWSAAGTLPEFHSVDAFNTSPSVDQIAFFESKIRPVLIERCYECHSVESSDVGGALLLDSRTGVIKGGESGAIIVPRAPESSRLIAAIAYADKELQMPPDEPLADYQINDFRQWIMQGAADPRDDDTVAKLQAKQQVDLEKARDFWSLRALQLTEPPNVIDSNWAFNAIDHFVLHQLEAANLAPAKAATRESWIRRATYDLTGLPPTLEQIDTFLADSKTDDVAFATVVDRLLSSEAYGERWGRHWMDVVRYSDTAGDNSDFPIPQMVRYRDWVIDAFNRDLPYDEFVRQQLAGDLMPTDSVDESQNRLIATGYLAGARRFGSRVDDYPQHLTIEDTIDNLGRAFLGSTINCARCHDHKFDPITADDYYALYGIFQSTRYPWPGIELEQKQRDLVPLAAKEIVEQEEAKRRQEQVVFDREVERLEALKKNAANDKKEAVTEELKKAREAANRNAARPTSYQQAYAVIDATQIQDAALQLKGDPAKISHTVPRRFLSVLGGQTIAPDDSTSGRLSLANWIVDPNNPLTARVMVNRIWLHHFGRGLVARPNDFGRQGSPPTHPALLDWLATRFIQSGWSIKSMHRDIMLSQTYRMASDRSPASLLSDPTNALLSSFPRQRLDAESIRDTLLMISGNLDLSRGGPHPFPPSTEWNFTQHNPFKAIYETNHRSVYLMTQRIQRHPYLAIFDGADPAVSTAMRGVSTTPLQALYFMNDPFVHTQAAGFADRVLQSSDDQTTQLENAFRISLGRRPNSAEVDRSIDLLQAVKASLVEQGVDANEARKQAWQSLARSMFRLNEFVYLD